MRLVLDYQMRGYETVRLPSISSRRLCRPYANVITLLKTACVAPPGMRPQGSAKKGCIARLVGEGNICEHKFLSPFDCLVLSARHVLEISLIVIPSQRIGCSVIIVARRRATMGPKLLLPWKALGISCVGPRPSG